jgi:hypothetical protein
MSELQERVVQLTFQSDAAAAETAAQAASLELQMSESAALGERQRIADAAEAKKQREAAELALVDITKKSGEITVLRGSMRGMEEKLEVILDRHHRIAHKLLLDVQAKADRGRRNLRSLDECRRPFAEARTPIKGRGRGGSAGASIGDQAVPSPTKRNCDS